MVKIASFNINGIRARLPRLLDWLARSKPDIVCLQELKAEDGQVPRLELEAAGYHVETWGQKGFNGVAILARTAIRDLRRGLPGMSGDPQARYIEATVGDLRVASIYVPNGNPPDSEKYVYKLRWLDALIAHAAALLATETPVGRRALHPGGANALSCAQMAGLAGCAPPLSSRRRPVHLLGLQGRGLGQG